MINDINDIALESYENIRYLLSSQLRLKILRILYEEDMTFNQIQECMDKQKSNILRTLKELMEINMISHDNKTYTLTSTGYLTIRNIMNLFHNWQTINKYTEDLNYYSLKNIPLEYSRYIHILMESEKIESTNEDYYKTRNIYTQKIGEAKNLKIILPIYSKQYLDSIQECMKNNNATLQLVTSRKIYEAIRNSNYYVLFKKFKDEGKLRVWVSEDDDHEIFLTITDKFSALSFFYNDETYDDTTFFWDETFNSKDLLEYLFESYKYSKTNRELI